MNDIYDENNFMFTNAAWIITSASGTISAVFSILIVSIILRSSEESRYSSYHIIMLFMSLIDVITSIAMALTTIPMPSNVYEVYPFKGKAYGNVTTCEIQGFIILCGTLFSIAANCALSIYYLCAIRYGISEEKIKRKLLPIMLVISSFLISPLPLLAVMNDSMNPQPLTNFCAVALYPIFCKTVEENQGEEEDNYLRCIRGNNRTYGVFRTGTISLGLFLFIILASLVLVLATMYEIEMTIRRTGRISRRMRRIGLRSGGSIAPEIEYKKARAALIQSLLYIVAFLLTWFSFMVVYPMEHVPDKKILIAHFFLRPLQGFFNALIFIYAKARSICEANNGVRFFAAFIQVITSPSSIPDALISGIEEAEVDRRVMGPLNLGEEPSNQQADPTDPDEASSSTFESSTALPSSTSLHTAGVILSTHGRSSIRYSGTTMLLSVAEDDENFGS